MTYDQATKAIGRTATILRVDNKFAKHGVGRSGKILFLVASCETAFAIDLNGDGRDPFHAFARNVRIEG